MDVYCSTGGFKNLTFVDTVQQFLSENIYQIELSSGKPINNVAVELSKIESETDLMLHNYFPPPLEPFVLNLASSNNEIYEKSINFFKESINLSALVHSKYYAIHSGFLVDPNVSQLGNTIAADNIVNREIGMFNFKNGVSFLADYAESVGVKLLVENNVINKESYAVNNENILLLCDPYEISTFIAEMNGRVGLLLDVAHLKVSSRTLGFNLISGVEELNSYTVGYHASENKGLRDDHEIFDENAWFFPYIDVSKSFLTLELNNSNPNEISRIKELTKRRLRIS